MVRLKILSFNWHEPYLCMLAKSGHTFDVAEPDMGRMGIRRWDHRIRPLPGNLSIVSQAAGLRKLKERAYDLALCHNFKDLSLVADCPAPALLLFHNKLTAELGLGKNSVKREKYLADVTPLAEQAQMLVFVSGSKREDWDFGEVIDSGRSIVIKPGVDCDEYQEFEGDLPMVLRVGNYMKEREIILGYGAQEKIVKGFSNTLLGLNPAIDYSKIPSGYEELKSCFAHHRLFLNTTVDNYEDGYNLAMIEAMAAGMPIVSTANRTSPITDGVEGFVSDDIEYLRSKIGELMSDTGLARRLGANAKKRAKEMFGFDEFIRAWNEAFNNTATIKRQSVETIGAKETGS